MNLNKLASAMFGIFLFVFLTACGGEPKAAPTPIPPTSPPAQPTELPATAVPAPTDAPVPTSEPVPTAVPTSEPTAEPEPTAASAPVEPAAGPDLIEVAQPDLFPEGIAYDGVNGRFLLSSIGEGTIYAVDDDGMFTPFIEDDALLSTLGLEIDAARNRLLVANTAYIFIDPSLASQAYLGVYDLTTGERLEMINLMEADPSNDHFANDIAVDADGNAYVTDSLGGVFKVDTDGNVSLFAGMAETIINPNGIVYHPDGYLIVANTGSASLYKVPLADPGSAAQIEINQPVLGDGMVWDSNGNLIVYDYGSETVLSLSSTDDWATAVIEAVSIDHHPASTLAVRGDQLYTIYPHFDDLMDGTTPDAFEIVLVAFGE